MLPDESKYFLALAYFQNQQNKEALRAIKGIKKDSIKELAENATFENLKKTSASFMVANLQEFKENKGFAAALKTVLESQTILSATERAAFYELQADGAGKHLRRLSTPGFIRIPARYLQLYLPDLAAAVRIYNPVVRYGSLYGRI